MMILGLNTTENPLWVEQKLKTYEEQELSMHVMSEFDPAIVSTNPQGLLNGGGPNGINFVIETILNIYLADVDVD
ncbi:Cadherin-87A [Armadillidium vulgare]|nr:Cadherin-87A [Armadillidium vulgare]